MDRDQRCISRLVLAVALATTAGWMPGTALAVNYARTLGQIAERLGKSSDEMAAAAGRLFKEAAQQSDEALERLAREIGSGGSLSDLAAALRKAGIPDADALARQFADADADTLKLITGIIEHGGKAIDSVVKGGGTVGDAISKIMRGGPNALAAIRLLDDPAQIRQCLDGFAKHGDDFTQFVIKGGDKALPFYAKYADEIAAASGKHLDDFLRNPTKYFDEFGKPTKLFDDVFRRPKLPWKQPIEAIRVILKRTGEALLWVVQNPIAAFTWLIAGAWLTGTLGPLLQWLGVPAWLVPYVLPLISLTILLTLVNAAAPWLMPLLQRLLGAAFRTLGRLVPGGAGRRLTRAADSIQDWQPPIQTAASSRRPLTIGIVGTKRVGKTTFIVMLTKHLARLVPGASLRPDGDAERKALAKITADVASGTPTTADKTLKLDLVWPFVRRPGVEGGTTRQFLVLNDFPGEWAAESADAKEREQLLNHLRGVDALMIVIDPTNLEGDSLKQQIDAIDRLFLRDGLDLGRRFKRAIALVVTKRDAIVPELMAKRPRTGSVSPEEEADLLALARKSHLTADDSERLAIGLLRIFAPTTLDQITGLLQQEDADAGRERPWFPSRHSSPQVKAFAISQLGKSLGKQVIDYRLAFNEWRLKGEQGPAPALNLDLDGVDSNEIEIHLPFKWIFDAVPEGLLHEANSLNGYQAARLRKSVHRRFKGAPIVSKDARIGWKRTAAAAVCLTAVTIASIWASVGWTKAQARNLIAEVRDEMTRGPIDVSRVAQVQDAIQPAALGGEATASLDRVKSLAMSEKRLEITESSGPLSLAAALEATREFDRVASWRTDETWRSDISLIDAVIRRTETPVIATLIKAVEAATAGPEQSGDYERAITDVRAARSSIPTGMSMAVEQDARRQLANKLTLLENRAADRDLTAAEARIPAIAPPDWIEAIRLVDRVILPDSVDQSIRTRRDQLRDRTIGQFWEEVKTKASSLNEQGEVVQAADVLDTFLAIPAPNSREPDARDLRDSLKRNYVSAAVAKAEGLLQNGKLDDAWAQIDRARIHRGSAAPDTRLAWWNIAIEITQRQRKYAAAWDLLSQPEPGDEREVQPMRQKLAESWQDYATQEASRLADNGEYPEAIAMLDEFLAVMRSPAQAVLRDAVLKSRQGLASRQLRDELLVATALLEESPADAWTKLEMLNGRIIALNDPTLVTDWAKSLVQAGRVNGKVPDALRLLARKVPEEMRLAEAIAQWWAEWADTLVKRAETSISQRKFDQGWQMYRQGLDQAASPRTCLELIDAAARKSWETRRSELEAKVMSLCDAGKFAEADAAVAEVRDESRSLADSALATSRALDEITGFVGSRKFSRQIEDAIDVGREQTEDQCQRKLKQIVAVLGNPLLTDRDRSRVKAAQSKLLDKWASLAYATVFAHYTDRNFPSLAGAVQDYLSPKAAYADSVDDVRRQRVKDLADWFEKFDNPVSYTVKGIKLVGVPGGGLSSLGSYFDPAFEMTVARRNDRTESATGAATAIRGAGTIHANDSRNVIRWAKGEPITIDIREGGVKNRSYSIGHAVNESAYALPALVTDPHSAFDPKSYYSRKGYDFKRLTQ
jgi:hypothetical protein